MTFVQATPNWALRNSPWGPSFDELTERSEWYGMFPETPPPFTGSPLDLAIWRKGPGAVPRVLGGFDASALLRSPLAKLMQEGAASWQQRLTEVDRSRVQATLQRLHQGAQSTLDPETLRTLMSPAADDSREEILALATARHRITFGSHRELYAPLYTSNACTNICHYCAFRWGSGIERSTLMPEQIDEQARYLATQGLAQVLLVAGEAPKVWGTEELLVAVDIAKRHFNRVGVEVFPTDELEYSRLVRAGIDSVTLYQETYDPQSYLDVHARGRKRDLLFRLGGPERALAAGIHKLGLGALLGLASFRFEAVALAMHVRELRRQDARAQISLSFPRLRATERPGEFRAASAVSEAELVHMMAALRLALPDVPFNLSTRESPRLRDRLAPALVNRLSAGSATSPGGYGDSGPSSRKDGAQFSLADHRSVPEVREALRSAGLTAS